MQLANVQADAGGSCDASFSTASQFGVFPRGASAAAARFLPAAPSGNLHVQCALPYSNGKPGGDCGGKHVMQWKVINGGSDTKVTAELLALDTSGNLLHSFIVKQGENVHMTSRLDPSDWKFKQGKGTYDIFAPVGMLKVTAESNGEKAEAFCSAIPYVDVMQPSSGVVSESNGESAIEFKAAVPRTNPSLLQLGLDGVNVLPLIAAQQPLGLASCQYDSPCEGVLASPAVTYKNLVIDVATNIGLPASNTISGVFEGVGCGSHFIRVSSGPDPGFRRTTTACHLDDLTDKGAASVFGITLTELGGVSDPQPGLITSQVPTEVKGFICSGTDILSANVNGKVLDVSGQVKVVGNGETVGDKVTLDIDTTLAQTDLKADFENLTTELGTFAPGSNRLLIAATEKHGTRAYERLMFAVGNNIKPLAISETAMFSARTMQTQMTEGLQYAIESKMMNVMSSATTTIDNAFIVGLSADGAQQILTNLCNAPIPGDTRNLRDIFAATVDTELMKWTAGNTPLSTFPFEPPCACNTTVPIHVESWEVGPAFSCPITFTDGELNVSLVLPNVKIKVNANKDQDCTANETHVHAWIEAELQNISFNYKLLAADLKNGTTTPGTGFAVGGKVQLDGASNISYGVLGDICNFFVEGFVTILTFGTVDIGPLLEPDIAFSSAIDLTAALSPAQPNAIPITGFNVEQQTNPRYHQEMKGEINAVSDVHITGPTGPGNTGAGITVGLKGTFATTSVDPLVEPNPGFEAKEPPLPTMASMQTQGVKDALIGLSQDSINMMFASLGANGDMAVPGADAQGCFPLGTSLGDLLPADCESIDITPGTNTDDIANTAARGYCHAIKGTACNSIVFQGNPDVNLTFAEQGICYGASGATCSTVAAGNLAIYIPCSITPNFNLHANQNLMLCAKADIPRMEFPTSGATLDSVPTNLQINDISVSLVLDRGTNNVPNNTVDDALANLPGCFSGTQTNADCNIFAACLDVNMKFAMNSLQPGNTVCEGGKPGLQAQFNELISNFRKVGEVCSGPTTPTTDQDALQEASNKDAVTDPIAANAAFFAPPICGTGLSVPNLFTCDQVAVVALEAGIDPAFKEFLGITCDLH
jgi:hypothetical protein